MVKYESGNSDSCEEKDDKEWEMEREREREICLEISETKELEIKRGFLTLKVKMVTNSTDGMYIRKGLEQQCPETLYRTRKNRG
jgi:hypothetical protein